MKRQLSRFTFFLLICLTLSTLNQTVVANLNVGEPRTVRLFYFLPNGRDYRQDVVDAMKTEILDVQSFYAEQMAAHGHGNMTFNIETDDQGEPIVHRVYGGSIGQMFDLQANVCLIVNDSPITSASGGAFRSGKNGGQATIFDGWNWFAASHELGHAFGLHHDFRDNEYILSYGRRNRSSAQLSACAAEYLSVHPYFNSEIPIEEESPPTIELISSAEYAAGSNSVTVQLKVSDSEGLHQVLLFGRTPQLLHPAYGGTELITCRGLTGETDTIVEFDYNGVIPSSGRTSLSDPVVHPIHVEAVDMAGNVSEVSFILAEVSPQHIATLEGHTASVYSVSFSPDGITLASGSGDGTVKLWNASTRDHIATLEGHTGSVYSVSFSPDGTILASGSWDGTVKLWNVSTKENIAILSGHRAVSSVSFSPDGTTLASGGTKNSRGYDSRVILWDVATRTNIATLEGHQWAVSSVSFSPDGITLASLGWTHKFNLWDVATRTNIATIENMGSRSVSFSPDGTTLASPGAGSDRSTIKLWNVAAREQIATLENQWTNSGEIGHTASVYSVAFSPDGTTLASAAQDKTVQLWNVATREHITIFSGHTDVIHSVSFSPDGTMLASASLDNKIKLWDTSEWAGTPVINHAPTGAVTISGTAAVGETLTADASAVMDPDGPETLQFSYQWLAGDVLIAGATSRTYTLTENETGETIRVRASYIDGFGAPVNVTSEATESAAPATTNTAPVFTDGTSTTRTVAENTAANVNIGTAIAAIDADNDTLTYTLGGTNAASFSIDSTSGQLKTRSALDYETKRTYTVTVVVSDGSLTDTITVTINVTDVEDTPVSTLTLLNGRTPQVRDAIVAAVPGINSANDVTAAHLAAITSLNIRSSDITALRSGDFDGLTALTTLRVAGTKLSSLPSGIFDNLTTVTELYLGGNNDLNSLPSGIFDNLIALKKLYLNENGMPSLRSGVFDNLTVLEELGLGGNDLRSLPSGIFDNLTALKKLNMSYNELVSLRSGIFDNNTALTELHLYYNDLNSLPSSIFDNNTALTTLTIWENNLSSLSAGIFDNNTALTNLSIGFNNFSSLPSDIFEKLTNLIGLGLLGNQFRSLPNGIFNGLPTLTSLNVSQNPVDPLPLNVSLEKVADGQFKAVAPTGAPFEIVLPLSIANGSVTGGATSVTIPAGSVESETLTITRTPGATYATTVNIGTLPGLPTGHQGYELTKPADLPLAFLELGGSAFVPVSQRTPRVRDAIVAAAGVNSANDVTEAHLAAITQLFLSNKGITSLKSGDFDGLTVLTEIYLNNNPLSSLPVGVFDGLTALTEIYLSHSDLSSLSVGVFDGLTALTILDLWGNDLSSLPVGVFDGLTALTTLELHNNTLDPLPLTVSLQKVADGQFKAVAPTGAPFEIVLPLIVTNGSINSGATPLTIPAGNVESEPLTVTRTVGTTADVTVDIGTLPRPPSGHTGYVLVKSPDLPLEIFSATATQVISVNIPDANLRDRIETALGKASGDPISAAEMATLTSLTAQDASISNLTGLETATNLTTLKLGDNAVSDISALAGLTNLTELQLWDNQISNISILASLTNLTKLYIWGNSISDISALAGLTSLTYLKISENTISNISILSRLTNLTELSLKDNAISDISALAGLTNLTELRIGNNAITNISAVAKLTNLVWLDAPNNSISDISAVANLTNLTSLMLTSNAITDITAVTGLTKLIELYLEENSISDISPLTANTGLGENTEIYVTGNPLSYPSIYTHIPALQARNIYVDFDNRVATAPVKISGDTQSGNTGTTLAQPFVVEVQDASRVAFAGVPVTFAVTTGGGTLSATNTTTDANGRAKSTLALGNTAGTNTVRVSVQGVSQTATFTATATTTNTAPTFAEGTSTTRSVAENTATGVNIGAAIAATDADNDTLIYTLGGTDAASFSIVSTSGQLKTRSALDYETKRTYTVTVAVSDGSLTDTITVTISVTDINELPTDAGVCQVGDVLAPGESCTYPGTDTEFSVLSDGRGQFLFFTSGTGLNIKDTVINGQPYTLAANKLASGSWKIEKIADSTETPGTTNTAPTFTEGASTARTVAENTATGVNIGSAIAATDADNDTLTYTLGGTNAASFGINSTTGQLRTRAALDYETKRSYTVTVTVTDGSFTGTIAVTINVTNVVENRAPAFTESSSTTRSVAENTATGVNIGAAIAATDADNDALTYTLSGTDAASFSIVRTSGQLRTRAALDYETKRSYTVTVTVSDGSFTDTITVTINVTDVADTPVVSTLTPVCDRTPQVRDAIVAAVRGVGDCNDVTDAHLAAIRGLLDLRNKNISALKPGDFDGLSSLQDIRLDRNQLRALPADIFSGLSSLRTLYLGDNQLTSLPADVFSELLALTDLFLHENRLASLPVDLFAGLSALRQINLHTNRLTTLPANVFSGLSSLTQIYLRNNKLTSLPADVFSGLSSLQYLYLDGNRLTSLPSDLFSELSSLTQLLLNNNQMSTLSVGMFRGLTASTQLWLQGNTVDPLPLTISLEKVGVNQFKASVSAGAPFTIVLPLRVANGSISGGVSTLTIPQGSVESGRLTMTRTSGTTAAVTVDIGTLPGLPANHRGYQLVKSTDLPLEIISSTGNRAPIFTEGASTTRTVAENTASGVNIGAVIAATDPDNDTLTYTLNGTDAASFSINSSTGQLQTKSALDYETKTTYTVTVTVSDGSLTDTITVTINITDVDELPTDTGVCKVGDILAPGESCTYPDTDATFSVLDNGHARWNIPGLPSWLAWANQVSIGGSLSFTATINDDNYHFVAEEGTNDSWEIKEIGDDRTQQPETPEQPQQPGETGGTPTLSASTTSPLTETTLDESVVTLTLSGRTYEQSNARIRTAVTISGIAGVTARGTDIDRVSDTQVTVELTFDRNINTDGTLTFTVGAGAIADYNGSSLTTQIPVTAVAESVVATTAAPLTEATLDESVVTLTLSGRTYEQSNARIRTAVTISGIAGVTARGTDIDRVSDTQVTVELTFDGNINTNGTLTFTVGADAIARYNGPALTAQVSVSAEDTPVVQDPDPPEQPITTGGEGETPTLSASTAAPLTEATLHEEVVTLRLSGGTYERSTFTIRDAVTVSGIAGVTVGTFGVDRVSDTEVTIELEFDGNINTNATLTFTVGAAAIVDYTGPALTAQIPVTANTKSVVATTVSPLTEATLDESVVTLALNGANYERSIFDIRGAVTVSAGITGVTVGTFGVRRISDTEVTVELEFDGTDFDTTSTLTFTVGAEAIAGYNGPALTTQISVTAVAESVVASTAAPLTEDTLDGSVVTLTLSGRTYERSTFRIRDAVTVSGISGVTVGTFDIDRVSDTEVTVELTFSGDFDTNSTLTFTVGAGAIAGYDGAALTAQVPVTATVQVLRAPSGISLMHVPLQVTAVDGVAQTIESVGDLYNALGGMNTVNLLITHNPKTQEWHSYLGEASRGTSADTVLTDNQGIIADMKTPVSLQLDGNALGRNGSSFITLHPGTNLVGAPLRDSRITRVSDLLALEGIGGNVSAITVSNNGSFQTVEQAGNAGDIPITGGQSFILNARETATVAISGQGWDNVSGIAAAAPGTLTGIQVGDTTPVLALTGSIVSSVGGRGRMPHLRSGSGFRVIVKNLATGRAVATVIGDTGDSYQLTVVDTETGQAARIGDILEISVRSPNPLIGVQPLRYTVTAEDVRRSRIQLPELTVYEIPAETELLRNYPNPFNPETWIPYRLAEDAVVNLTIYDTAGRVVRTIDVGYKPAAVYESRAKAIYWDGRNEFGEQAASGVYFYHLSAGDFSATRKMLILK